MSIEEAERERAASPLADARSVAVRESEVKE